MYSRIGCSLSRLAAGRGSVHPILEYIEIKRTQVDDSELIYRVIDAMEFEGLVPSKDLLSQIAGTGEHVSVEWKQIGFGDLIAGRIELVEIAEQKAKSIAQLAINLSATLHQIFAGRHVFSEIDRSDPQANDFAAHTISDIDWIDAVAEGLRHGATLLIKGPARRGNVRVRRTAAKRDGRQQR